MHWESLRVQIDTPYPAFHYYHTVRGYFGGGEWNAHEVESVLDDVGFAFREAGSFLEFACGYGRLTRHFVHMISPSRITVSDVDRRAVDFVKRELGLGGFYSTPTAEGLDHEERYDVIVVVSLFSHLSIQHWGPWLARLSQMLNPDGLLLLTAQNINNADERDFEVVTDGFLYKKLNETRGRLDVDNYGATYVSEAYVERAVSASFGGRLLKFCPHALLLDQDAYVLQRVDRV